MAEGVPCPASGLIDAPIEREKEGSIKRIVCDNGKPSKTKYTVIKSFDDCSLCELELITGRTHQIRVHMAHIGHPLVGDFLYGNELPCGYFLHCRELSFHHPITGETMRIVCEPKDFPHS